MCRERREHKASPLPGEVESKLIAPSRFCLSGPHPRRFERCRNATTSPGAPQKRGGYGEGRSAITADRKDLTPGRLLTWFRRDLGNQPKQDVRLALAQGLLGVIAVADVHAVLDDAGISEWSRSRVGMRVAAWKWRRSTFAWFNSAKRHAFSRLTVLSSSLSDCRDSCDIPSSRTSLRTRWRPRLWTKKRCSRSSETSPTISSG